MLTIRPSGRVICFCISGTRRASIIAAILDAEISRNITEMAEKLVHNFVKEIETLNNDVCDCQIKLAFETINHQNPIALRTTFENRRATRVISVEEKSCGRR